jgi:hypothetical protein
VHAVNAIDNVTSHEESLPVDRARWCRSAGKPLLKIVIVKVERGEVPWRILPLKAIAKRAHQ